MEVKSTRNNFWSQFGSKELKSSSKLGFFTFSQVWFISFPWNCTRLPLGQCLASSRVGTFKIKFCDPNWAEMILCILMSSCFHSNLLVFSSIFKFRWQTQLPNGALYRLECQYFVLPGFSVHSVIFLLPDFLISFQISSPVTFEN